MVLRPPTLALVALTLAVLPATPRLHAQMPPPAGAARTQPRDLDPGRLVADQIATLARQMSDPASDQEARDIAARRLLSIGTAEARNAVQYAMRDPGNVGGRLAAARAVADDLPPDPAFVDPLFVLMESDQRPLSEAAALALGNYKMMPEVATRLIPLTDGRRREPARLAAVRGLGSQVEKRAAQRLVELTRDPSPAVSEAAVDALQTLASLPLANPREWADWWRSQSEDPEDRFRLEMLTARATRFEQRARRGEDTFQELRRSVLATLAAAPRDGQADAINRLLSSPREAVRLIAVRQAHDLATTGDLPADSREPVRALLADPSPDVRLEAARTMEAVNDPGAFDAIARQIAVEPDTRVRAELARAIGPIGNVDAVPLLRWLLDDSSPTVVQSAAVALARLGRTIADTDPATAAELAFKLQAVLQARASGPGDATVREALIEALVPLRQKSLLQMFSGMLIATQPREPERIRVLAAQGLGAIGEPRTGDLLVEAMHDESPAVRTEAILALGKVSNSFVYADSLYRAMDPAREKDARTREAAWSVIRDLLPVARREQLADWPDRPLLKGDHARRLEIYTALATKASAVNDNDDFTLNLRQVGDTQMRLAEQAEKRAPGSGKQIYADATASYQRALAITRQTAGPPMRVEGLIEATLRSLLQGRDYAGATRFAADLVRDPAGRSFQGLVAKEFKLEAERLNELQQFDDAQRMISQALAMTPALPDQYANQLRDIRNQIQARQNENNLLDTPGWFDAIARR